jgi:hypothetical protein
MQRELNLLEFFVEAMAYRKNLIATFGPTSFPGSSLFLRKDPGRGWSRVTQILGKLKLFSGRGSRGAVCCVWKIAILCVIVLGDKNVICNKKS